LPLINASVCGISEKDSTFAKDALIYNYPNPFSNFTKIEFKTKGGHTLLQLLDGSGSVIRVLVEATYSYAGMNSFNLYSNGLVPGVYYIRLQNEDKIFVKAIIKM
jgi:hypothetical protein